MQPGLVSVLLLDAYTTRERQFAVDPDKPRATTPRIVAVIIDTIPGHQPMM
jgi:hypothetical protein